MKKILYVRSGPYQVNPNSYNLQEIGLARALYECGYQCDVMYYNKKKNFDEEINKEGVKIKLLWRRGIRLFRSGIYPQILKKNFLNQYDIVICSEYSQIMSVLLCKIFKNTYIYNGPYYNLFKIPFIEKIYDVLFCKFINNNCKKVFCKTKLAEEYLNKKGIKNTLTIGVGLDIEKFNNDKIIDYKTQEILNIMKEKRNLLYIGSISKRKNVEFIIKSFLLQTNINDNKQLIIVGKGKKKYVNYCHSIIPNEYKNKIKWFDYINNSQTQYLYKNADAFILPSKKEIFGMVLLESMYFGTPVISSNSAGAMTLIENNQNGFIIDKFEENRWKDKIKLLLENTSLSKEIGNNAQITIKEKFMWTKVCKKIVENMQI